MTKIFIEARGYEAVEEGPKFPKPVFKLDITMMVFVDGYLHKESSVNMVSNNTGSHDHIRQELLQRQTFDCVYHGDGKDHTPDYDNMVVEYYDPKGWLIWLGLKQQLINLVKYVVPDEPKQEEVAIAGQEVEDVSLYQFLQDLVDAGPGEIVSGKEIAWAKQFLQAPGHELHFFARETGQVVGTEKVYFQHYAMKGEPEDIFCLVTEAMLQNPTFAQLILGARDFYLNHAPLCRHCSQRHNGRFPQDCPDVTKPTWEFKRREK